MRKTGIFFVFFIAFAAGIAIPQGTGGMQTPQQPLTLVAEVKAPTMSARFNRAYRRPITIWGDVRVRKK